MKKLRSPDLSTVQTINECPQRSAEPGLAHSKGKPDVLTTTTNISVRFAAPLIMEIQIRVMAEGRPSRPIGVDLALWWTGDVHAATLVE